MTRITQAICWATAIGVAALASRFGVMDRGSATTLLIVLPVVAWTALTGRGSCALGREA
ncbi:MAG: hypothetical protein J2O44_00160 [Porphyrobacter sp.]|nr:hypothetical protein [Porphyrobacter sp.]